MISADYDDREKVELYLTCSQLRGQQNRYDIKIRCSLLQEGKWMPIGETEIIEDNPHPGFTVPISIDYIFEQKQITLFEILNVYNPNQLELIGTVQTKLSSIMGSRRQTANYNITMRNNEVTGQLVVQGERVIKGDETILWQWRGENLKNTDRAVGGKSDPFLRFYKIREDRDLIKVHETEHVQENLDPVWDPFRIQITKLCHITSNPIRIECWDSEREGKHQFIGRCDTTIDAMIGGAIRLELRDSDTQATTGYLEMKLLEKKYSFLDYLRGGTQLNAVLAIDFTSSNGHPTNASSLHYINPNGSLNEYQKAIESVCEIILNYDHDKSIPVYGFGGKPQNSQSVSHCFPCTGDDKNPEVKGLDGIMKIYKESLEKTVLASPTLFEPVLNAALNVAQTHKEKDDNIYTILLILTDGEIHDMYKSTEAVCKASELPLSIIIVGIGNEDFTDMEKLDGDHGLVDSKGKKASRDAVQFVPFRKFNSNQDKLAEQVLHEVPDQVVQYMKNIGSKPRPSQIV